MNTAKEKNMTERTIQELLSRFDSIWNLEVQSQDYRKNSELSDIANQILSMKLRDEFLVANLSPKEKEICNRAIIIAQVK